MDVCPPNVQTGYRKQKFFSKIFISMMIVKINLRIISTKYAVDTVIQFPTKSISVFFVFPETTRQRWSWNQYIIKNTIFKRLMFRSFPENLNLFFKFEIGFNENCNYGYYTIYWTWTLLKVGRVRSPSWVNNWLKNTSKRKTLISQNS